LTADALYSLLCSRYQNVRLPSSDDCLVHVRGVTTPKSLTRPARTAEPRAQPAANGLSQIPAPRTYYDVDDCLLAGMLVED